MYPDNLATTLRRRSLSTLASVAITAGLAVSINPASSRGDSITPASITSLADIVSGSDSPQASSDTVASSGTATGVTGDWSLGTYSGPQEQSDDGLGLDAGIG